MARYRMYHVNAAGTSLIEKILFDAPIATTNAVPNFSVSDTGSFYGVGETIVRTYSEITENPTLQMPFLKNTNEGYFNLHGAGVLQSQFDFANISIGDKFYLGRWDNSHSYIKVTNKTQTVNPNTRGDYEIYLDYCLYDGTVVYSNVHIYCRWISNRTCIEFLMLPWLWNFNGTGGWNICGEHIWLDLGAYGGYRENYVAPSSAANAQAFWNNVPIIDDYNPYEGAGESGEAGGDSSKQNWDDHSDAITPDGLPTKGAIASGMLSVFSPSETQVANLCDLLFSYNFFDWLQKNLQNLEEIFVSFGVVPFTVTKGSSVSVTWLGFDISSFTHPVYLTEAAEQFYEFDMGSIALDGSDSRIHASDSVFDYSPFSKLGIYLPFIGYEELDIDECRGCSINLVYRVDIVSGSCVALIYVNADKDRCIYQFSGNCLTQIPLGSVDMSGIISGSISIATAAASAGATAAVASAGDALTAERVSKGKLSEAGANVLNHQRGSQVSDSAGGLISATVNGVMGMKPNFKHSGAIGNSGSGLSVKQPYLFLVTPREAVPSQYQKYCGFPSNITDVLGNFSGYTVVEDIRLNGLVATSPEVEEIYQLLTSGVIV